MKKKISLLGLIFVLIFSITGCGSKAKSAAEYDQATMSNYADTVLQSFNNMTSDDMDNFKDMSDLELNMTLLQSGLPIESDDFLAMIDAWQGAVSECGAFEEMDDYKLETTNSGATLTTEAKFADRNAEISFTFDEKMNMSDLTISAHYTTGEILKKAGLNTVLGMGTVFVVLIFISFIISLFKYIPALEKKFSKKSTSQSSAAPAPAPVPAAIPVPETVDETDDGELAAVIAAAVAAAEGTSTDGFIVRSIKRRKSNKWN